MRSLLYLLFGLLLFTACKKKSGPDQNRTGVYYWQTSLNFDRKDQSLADSLGTSRFYLRYFDVDWSPSRSMPVPVGDLMLSWDQPSFRIESFQLIPVVYITNRVFSHEIDVEELAGKISAKVRSMNDQIANNVYAVGWKNQGADLAEIPVNDIYPKIDSIQDRFKEGIKEVQIDCDWTPNTRDTYFRFLLAMKENNPGLEISFTLRLHQFRDPENAGVPPLKKAVLMCYNVAPVHLSQTVNAIFDPALIKGYLKNADYPLEMDAALPLFSWGALFHEDQFKGLAGGLAPEDVIGNPLFEAAGDNRYRFLRDTVFFDQFMREGDIVRVDGPTKEGLNSIAGQLAKIKNVGSLIFFEWDPEKIRTFHADKINAAFQGRR